MCFQTARHNQVIVSEPTQLALSDWYKFLWVSHYSFWAKLIWHFMAMDGKKGIIMTLCALERFS